MRACVLSNITFLGYMHFNTRVTQDSRGDSKKFAVLQYGEGDARLVLSLGLSEPGRQQQLQAGGHLQAVGEPGQGKGPAEGHVHAGQGLGRDHLLEVLHGLVGVLDVDADPS